MSITKMDTNGRILLPVGIRDKLDLNLTTLGTINLYKLSLTRNGDFAAGEYSAYSADGQSRTGSAKGTKSVGWI